MASYELSEKEKSALNRFLEAMDELHDLKDDEATTPGSYHLRFHPTAIGVAVEVCYEYPDGKGGFVLFKKDITDHADW